MSKRYLLDTGPAQDFLFRRRSIYDRAKELRRAGHIVGICTPVLGEIRSGIEFSSSRDENEIIVNRNIGYLRNWPYTDEAAMEFGRLSARLKRMGRPMQQIDVQIAAIALTLGRCTVVSADTDLHAIPGLTVENWSVPSS